MLRFGFFVGSLCALGSPALAQGARDAAATLGRDLGVRAVPARQNAVPLPVANNVASVDPRASTAARGLLVGAVNIEGAREIPRDIFAPVIEPFIGTETNAQGLQLLARAIATKARERGYIFASAIVPEQTVDAGAITVRLDAGAVDHVRIVGSKSKRLQRLLDVIVGPAVRQDVLEGQLLLAGDMPGITVVSAQYVRETNGATLVVGVKQDRVAAFAGLDNYGSQALGPARAQLKLDLTGLLDDDDLLTTQIVVTPLQPKELAYGSLRYSIGIGATGRTRIGATAAVGKTRPGDVFSAGLLTGDSLYGAIFVNHALLRSNKTSAWLNAEFAWLRVNEQFADIPYQRDAIATLMLSTTLTTKLWGGRIWGGFGVVKGLGLADTTRANDPGASRFDGSGVFTKLTGWADWTRSIGKHWSIRAAANAQLANRPLLAAQEIAVGGPVFGRAYEFSERFGDSGILGLFELRQQFDKLVKGIDWVQFYQFADGGYVENMQGGFGDGTRWSAGAGFRAGLGKTQIGAELAFPLGSVRQESGNRSPRVNLTVGRNF